MLNCIMEEFKKPCLPIIPTKVETTVETADKEIEKLDDEVTKPEETVTPTKPLTQMCPYKTPVWSQCPSGNENYSFEVLKSGQIIEEIKELQKKAYWTFGRLPENDIEMAHPTISRFHAILQYRPQMEKEDTKEEDENTSNKDENKGAPKGWYIYDLGSTHGTFLNKQRIPAKVYIRIRVGHLLRLGASTRTYILQGPSEDEEPESELTITELKAKRQQDLEEAALAKKRLAEEAAEKASNEGCSWGMTEDADEETDLAHNPYASTNNEELFLDDPKKTLRGYFEREGLELVYKCDEMSAGSFVCRVELPLDDANGRPIVAEVVHKGRKKDCVVQCALEACRLLDRHGVLRQANQEPLKRKQKSQGSDSDDDEFWDRTGDVARKKQRKEKANTSVTLTYEDLLKQETDLKDQLQQIESNITAYQEQQKLLKQQKAEEGEDLDAFMENLQGNDIKMDKTEIRKLRLEEQRIKLEQQKVQRLLKIAKPLDLSFIKPTAAAIETQTNNKDERKKQLPMIGKRNQFSKFKVIKVDTTVNKIRKPVKFTDSDEEEVEEVEEEEKEEQVKSSESEENKNENKDISITAEEKDLKEERINANKEISNELNEQNSILTDNTTPEQTKTAETMKIPSTSSTDTIKTNEPVPADSEASIKKRRQRIRQRGKRQEVDMDDDAEYESTDKYAKWVPPENQTGDGFTELNEKFGY